MNRTKLSARVAGTALLVALGTTACGGGAEPAPSPTAPPTSAGPDVTRAYSAEEVRQRFPERPSLVFGAPPVNPYRLDVRERPVDPNGHYLIDNLKAQIAANNNVVPINTEKYGSSYVLAPEGTPKHRIAFDNCQKKPYVPKELYEGPAYFDQVPIPEGALPASGTDAAMAIWEPATDKVWEFWIVRKRGAEWSACWGGRIDGAKESKGVFPAPFGTSASGLVTFGTAITAAEGEKGEIEHAMGLALRSIAAEQHRPTRLPANRTDGLDWTPAAIPMGTRLRLDPAVDVDALQLPPLGKAVARAAQTYGFIITETAGVVGLNAQTGDIEKAKTGKNPWEKALAGVPEYAQLQGFPWDKLQVLAPEQP